MNGWGRLEIIFENNKGNIRENPGGTIPQWCLQQGPPILKIQPGNILMSAKTGATKSMAGCRILRQRPRSRLPARVSPHPLVRIDGDEVLRKSIEDSSWQDFQFDPMKHEVETIRIERENRPSDRCFEAASWRRIELIEKDVELNGS